MCCLSDCSWLEMTIFRCQHNSVGLRKRAGGKLAAELRMLTSLDWLQYKRVGQHGSYVQRRFAERGVCKRVLSIEEGGER
jgi:hypothetical protein